MRNPEKNLLWSFKLAFSLKIWPHCISSRCTQLVMEKIQNRVREEKKTVHLSLPSFCILPWWISHQSLAESSDIHSLYRQSPLEILVESRGYRLIFMRSDFFFRHDSFPAGSVDSTVALWFIGSMFESGNSRFIVTWTRFISLHQPETKTNYQMPYFS